MRLFPTVVLLAFLSLAAGCSFEPLPPTPTPMVATPSTTFIPPEREVNTPVPFSALSGTIMNVPSTWSLSAIAARSPEDVWVVGDTGDPPTRASIAHWNGQKWDRLDNPTRTPHGHRLRAVVAIAADDVWAVGDYDNSDEPYDQRPMIVHWDGATWSFVPTPVDHRKDVRLSTLAALASNDVWAAGEGALLRWNGKSWESKPQPPGGDLTSLTVESGRVVWGLSREGRVARWDGTAWQPLPLMQVTPTATPVMHAPLDSAFQTFTGIAVPAPNDVWVVGVSTTGAMTSMGPFETPLLRQWNGSTWSEVQPTGPIRAAAPSVRRFGIIGLPSIVALAPDNVWVLIGEIFHWNGEVWETVAPPACDPGVLNVSKGIVANSGEIWVVGGGAPNMQPRSESYGGYVVRYTSQPCVSLPTPAGDPPTVRPVATATPTRTLTPLPLPGCSEGWSMVPAPTGIPQMPVEALAIAGPGDIWGVGTYHDGKQFRTGTFKGDGRSWRHVPSPNGPYPTVPGPMATADPANPPTPTTLPTDSRLNAVSARSPDDVWAVGSYFQPDSNKGQQALILHWDGRVWSLVPLPSNDWGASHLEGVVALAADDVWAVGGFSEHRRSEALHNTLTMHWDGKSWQVVPSPNGGSALNELSAVAGTARDDVWAVGSYNEPSGGPSHTLIMHWDGTSWSVVPSPDVSINHNSLVAVSASARDDAWAVGSAISDGRAINSTGVALHWDGRSWTAMPVQPPDGGSVELRGVVSFGPADAWAVGFGAVGPKNEKDDIDRRPGHNRVFHWDGRAWREVAAPRPGIGSNLYTLAATGPTDIWALGTYSNNSARGILIEHYSGACR